MLLSDRIRADRGNGLGVHQGQRLLHPMRMISASGRYRQRRYTAGSYGMVRDGSAFLDHVDRSSGIGEDDMEADHHFTSTDGPSGPSCGGGSALGLVPQLVAGALGPLTLDHSLRCGSVCFVPGRLGL